MFGAVAQSNTELWHLVTNLATILGFALPLVYAGWKWHAWLVKNFASKEALSEIEDELGDKLASFKEAMDERSITDCARYQKLEREYLELLRVLAKTKKH